MPFLRKGKTNIKYFLIVFIIAVIVSGGILVYSKNINKQTISSSQTSEIKILEKVKNETVIKPLEKIVLLSGNGLNLNEWDIKQISVGEWGDSKLIIINKETKQEKTLINSTFELRDYIGQNFEVASLLKKDGVIGFIGSSEKGDEIYFMLSYEYGGSVFGLNINSLNLREIKSADFFALTVAYSPKGDKAIVGEKKYPGSLLYLVCFENDSKKIIFTPKIEETLHKQLPELDDQIYVKWLDDNTIEYKIYEVKSKITDTSLITNPLIGKYLLKVPDCY